MKHSEKIQKELSREIISKHKSWLWSYNIADENVLLSDQIIIEKYLIWGSKSDWVKIKQVFSPSIIKDIWLNNLVPSGMYEEKQRRIAKYFFNISQPSKYLKNVRKKHLNDALAGIN